MNPATLGRYIYNRRMWYNAACGIGSYPYTDLVLFFSGLAVKGLTQQTNEIVAVFCKANSYIVLMSVRTISVTA